MDTPDKKYDDFLSLISAPARCALENKDIKNVTISFQFQ
ncbi:MAG: hypothetical protein JWP44_3143 [Mucilaginibacter sp.]|nr:hypothetical protein [Mucilaginibacter sp.]